VSNAAPQPASDNHHHHRTVRRDLVVVGASAGGLEALIGLVAGLPPDFAAAVCVVLHTAPSGPGRLPAILQRASALPVSHGEDGEPLLPGRVYVARPDHHLLVDADVLRVTRGPRENHTRPAVDPLFRSAALARGPRVVGVVLTGLLDDGTAGLGAIKMRGGTAVVQDPAQALYPDMPRNAMRGVAVDHVVGLSALPALLVELVREPASNGVAPMADRLDQQMRIEVRIAKEENALKAGVMGLGPPTPYTCPECHGVLLQLSNDPAPRFRCHTGHAFAIDTLLSTVTQSVEETLWSGLRAIEESVLLLREMARHAREANDPVAADRLDERAAAASARSELVRRAALEARAVSRENLAGAPPSALAGD
jgi:two-component system chemotaxis response regulator CheB